MKNHRVSHILTNLATISLGQRLVRVRVVCERQRWFVQVRPSKRLSVTCREERLRNASRCRTSTRTPNGVARWSLSWSSVRCVASQKRDGSRRDASVTVLAG
jgi:hypothetical protein